MPKLKTKSACKKRFKITGLGKLVFKQTRKSHRLDDKTGKWGRQKRIDPTLPTSESKKVLKTWMPYDIKVKKKKNSKSTGNN